MGRPSRALTAAKAGGGHEGLLALHVRLEHLPAPELEYRFHPTRAWRFDLAWPDLAVAAEVEGGLWAKPGDDGHGGRHNRVKGFEADCEKYAEAAILGWKVVRFSTTMVEDGRAIRLLARLLREEETDGSTVR